MGRWTERPYLLIFPITAALAAIVLAASVRYRRDNLPFPMVVVIFVSAFGTLAISSCQHKIEFSFLNGNLMVPAGHRLILTASTST
jgi:cytochrome bd ubiquinol oxidase subunit II